MRFREFLEGFIPGQIVKVPRSDNSIDTDWKVVNFDQSQGKYLVIKPGVGSKYITQQRLAQVNPEERPSIAFNRQLLTGSDKSIDYYVRKALEWLKLKDKLNDLIVRNTSEDWYKSRAKQMLTLVKTFTGPMYRCITVNSIDEINWDNLGISWAFNINGAKCYHGSGGKQFTLVGWIDDPSWIDVDTTVLYYLIPHYAKENEIRLKYNAPITIQYIDKTKVNKVGHA